MKNKVLIRLYVPEINETFDVYIPVNELIWRVKELLIKTIEDLININLDNTYYVLINSNNSNIYSNNTIVINTDIRNGTELILLSIKDN